MQRKQTYLQIILLVNSNLTIFGFPGKLLATSNGIGFLSKVPRRPFVTLFLDFPAVFCVRCYCN